MSPRSCFTCTCRNMRSLRMIQKPFMYWLDNRSICQSRIRSPKRETVNSTCSSGCRQRASAPATFCSQTPRFSRRCSAAMRACIISGRISRPDDVVAVWDTAAVDHTGGLRRNSNDASTSAKSRCLSAWNERDQFRGDAWARVHIHQPAALLFARPRQRRCRSYATCQGRELRPYGHEYIGMGEQEELPWRSQILCCSDSTFREEQSHI